MNDTKLYFELVEGEPHPDPITDCHHYDYSYRYLCTADVIDPIIATVELAAAEVQETLFWDGAVTAGHFRIIAIREDTLYFVIERDCNGDFHRCYMDDVCHDGSDTVAIEQLQGEVDEAYQFVEDEPMIANIRVRSRRVTREGWHTHLYYASDVSKIATGEI